MFEIQNLQIPGRLAPLSWQQPEPALVALIGPNGSGKSTLLLALANLLSATGSVRLQNHALRDLDMPSAARIRAMLPQRQPALLSLSCLDVLHIGLATNQVDQQILRTVLDELVQRFELGILLARDFCQLSGGEQQRVLIARTLLQIWPDLNPQGRLLLLDEPLAGLDWHHQLQLLDVLQTLVRRGVLIIMSIHDFNLALAYADGLLCMQAGKLVAQGSIDLLDAVLLERVFQVKTDRMDHAGRSFFMPTRISSAD